MTIHLNCCLSAINLEHNPNLEMPPALHYKLKRKQSARRLQHCYGMLCARHPHWLLQSRYCRGAIVLQCSFIPKEATPCSAARGVGGVEPEGYLPRAMPRQGVQCARQSLLGSLLGTGSFMPPFLHLWRLPEGGMQPPAPPPPPLGST